jgi:iron complex outermembrane receptor protein
MLKLKRNVLSVALASAILSVAGGVRAQDAESAEAANSANATKASEAPDAQGQGGGPSAEPEAQDSAQQDAQELEEIVVTGIRAGIETSTEVKKEETSIVEVVSSEDLGKLPDISIAESISRLPGIAAQRVAGRASTVSIRGLAGDYGTTLLNGREQVSVGDNRTVEFDQYPSELINQVVVYKTPDASLVGQGLSGTVDLRTVRPLMFDERTVSFNVRGENNSLGELNSDSDEWGSRISAFYLDQFMDDRLGIALGYARLDSPGQAERFEAWGYPTDIAPAQGAFTLGGGKLQASSTDTVREGYMGVLEFNASENYSMLLDVYYSEFEKAETTRFMELGLGWGGGVTQSNPTIEDGVVTQSTFNNVRPVVRNDLNEGDDELFAIGWNNVFRFGEAWTATVDLSYSSADRHESILETYSGLRNNGTDTVLVELDDDFPTFSFGRDYTDPTQIVLTDPGGWGQDGYLKTPEIEDELTSYRIDLARSFIDGPFSSLEFGLNYADREKQRSVPEFFLDLVTDQTVVPANFLIDPVDLGHVGVDGSLSYDINGVLGSFYNFRPNAHPDITNKQWVVNEELLTAYAQLNLNMELGSIPLRGNIGIQIVDTDQSSDGFSVTQGNAAAAQPFSGGAEYTDYLPSANLVFEQMPWDTNLRVALGRQMARPRVDQMRANNNTNLEFSGVNQGLWTRSGGNPELEPWVANAADVSWEKYFAGTRGYFAIAYYYKDLRTYVYDQTTTFDASGLTPPPGYTGPTPRPVGFYTRPSNGEGGNIKGWEFSLSVPFDLFAPALEGFGFVGNYSDASSSIKRLGPDGPDEPIAGLSDKVQNLTLYYENYGFSARISQRRRSEFLGEIQGFGADRALVNIDGETVYDFQTGYSFGDGTLEGLSVLLQINNLTDEPYRQFFSGNGLTQRLEKYGKQYLLGVTYRF